MKLTGEWDAERTLMLALGWLLFVLGTLVIALLVATMLG